MAATDAARDAERKALPMADGTRGTREFGATGADEGVLDHPVWTSLSGPHSRFSQRRAAAARYPAPISNFAALAPWADDEAWNDLAALTGPERTAVLVGEVVSPPEGWDVVGAVGGLQMIDVSLDVSRAIEAEVLVPDDVPEMLELVRQTRPGPFASRTIELEAYLGLRRDGALVAMAGQRLHPPGWTEISAVCTRPDHRGHGLASGLVRSLGAEIHGRGETPFLHVAANNRRAIGLYQSLGFTVRREINFAVVQTRAASTP